MIKGPFPLSDDMTHHVVPIEGSFLTPMYRGERVAIRVSSDDENKATRGPGWKGNIIDLDTGKCYSLWGLPCSAGKRCYCDVEILETI